MKTSLTIQLDPAFWLRETRTLNGNKLGLLTKVACKSADYKKINNILTFPPKFFQPGFHMSHPI